MQFVRSTAVDPQQVSTAHSNAWLVFAIIVNLAIALYLLPTLVALIRHVRNVGTIAIINIFLGWSFYGWVTALALACQHVDKPRRSDRQRAACIQAHCPGPGWSPDPSSAQVASRALIFGSSTASTASAGLVVDGLPYCDQPFRVDPAYLCSGSFADDDRDRRAVSPPEDRRPATRSATGPAAVPVG